MANPLKGKEVRQVVSVRMEPSHKQLLIEKYGSVQAAIDSMIKAVFKIKREKHNGQENEKK